MRPEFETIAKGSTLSVPGRKAPKNTVTGIGFIRPDKWSMHGDEIKILNTKGRSKSVNYVKVAIIEVGEGLPVRVGLTPMYDVDIFRDIELDIAKIRNAARNVGGMSARKRNQLMSQLLHEYVNVIPDEYFKGVAQFIVEGWSLHSRHGGRRPDVMPVKERDLRVQYRSNIDVMRKQLLTDLACARISSVTKFDKKTEKFVEEFTCSSTSSVTKYNECFEQLNKLEKLQRQRNALDWHYGMVMKSSDPYDFRTKLGQWQQGLQNRGVGAGHSHAARQKETV